MTTKKPGDVLDRYVIDSLLGQGGMGAVYAARDSKLGRQVALKILLPNADTIAHARLLREARTVAAFEHPNAVVVYDVGEAEGVPFLSMELVRGRALRGFIGDQTIPISQRLRWLADIARALAAAHRAGIVHRDVKPDNVMMREDGVVKVLDFGIARLYASDQAAKPETNSAQDFATLTEEGLIVGTPLYLAPEQLVGEPLDRRVDQFAWAVMAYELIAGECPWKAVDRRTLTTQILTFEPKPLREHLPRLSREIEHAVQRAMSKRASDRFASLDEAADILELFADGKRAGGKGLADNVALAPTEAFSAGDESNHTSALPFVSTALQQGATTANTSVNTLEDDDERNGTAEQQIDISTASMSRSPLASNTGAFFRIARTDVVWSRRERVRASALTWMGALLAGGIGTFVVACMSVVFKSSWLTGILLAFSAVIIACGGIASLIAVFGGRKPETTRGISVEVHDDELFLKGATNRQIFKTEVVGGWLENAGSATNGDVWNVLLALRDNTEIALKVGDRQRGDELLRALGVSIADRVLRVPLRSIASMTPRGELLGIIALLGLLTLLPIAIGLAYGMVATLYAITLPTSRVPANAISDYVRATIPPVGAIPLILLGLWAIYTFLQRRTAIVGMDGVAIQRSGKRDFVTYSQIKQVVRDPRGVRLELDNGKNVLLPVLLEAGVPLPISAGPGPNLDTIAAELPPTLPVNTPRATLYKKDVARREVLVARLEQAMAYSRESDEAKRKWAFLEQQGDTIAAWKRRLQNILRSDADLRDVDIADAELLEVVEDRTAKPERRIAAAVAISTSVNKMTRKRIRIAVDACADDDVRAALEAAAEGELEESLLARLRSRS